MKKFYAKLKASLAKAAGLLMLLMAMLVPLGAWGQVTILSENFNTGLPATWSAELDETQGYSITWQADEEYKNWAGDQFEASDPYIAYANGPGVRLFSPEFDISSYDNVKLSFTYMNPNCWGSGCIGSIQVYTTNDGTNWSALDGGLCDVIGVWTPIELDLNSDVIQIAFGSIQVSDMQLSGIDDVIITGEESGVTKYNINYATGLTGGSISGKTKAEENEEVEVTVEPFEHWYLTNMTVTKTGESSTVVYTGSSNVFTMPAYDVDVTAIFAEKAYHYFTNNIPSSNADVRFEDYWGTEIYGAYVDDEVYVRITEKPGFELASLSYNSTPIDISSGTGLYSFTMPDTDVSLTATFNTLQMYSISCSAIPSSFGTVSCSPATAAAGTTITLTPSANSGYMLAYYVVKGETSGNEITVNNNQFTMPSENVTVKGVFSTTSGETSVLYESFNTNAEPPYGSGWTQDYSTGTISWGKSSTGGFDGNRCAYHNKPTYKMVSPSIDMAGATSAKMTFYLKSPSYTYYYGYYSGHDNFTAYYRINGGDWIQCSYIDEEINSHVQKTVNLPVAALASNCQLAFQMGKCSTSGNGSGGVWFDELYVYKTVAAKYLATTVSEHGSVTLSSGNTIKPGETVTVNVAADYGYRLTNITVTNDVDGSPIMVTENQFTMPNAPVTVTATYEEVEVRNITITKEGNGTIYTNPEDIAEVGGTVYVYCYADYHWTYNDDLTITYEDGGTQQIVPEEVSYGTYSFTMPAFDVNINASFTEEAKYAINVVKFGSEDSEITLSKSSPTYGYEYVTITANPAAGYMLGRLKVRKDATGEEITVTNNSFTMPAENVTVYASFYEGFEFFEDFETNPADKGWTYASSGSGNWQWTSGGHSGNSVYCSYSNAYYSPYIITPEFNFEGFEGLKMTFWRKQPNYSGRCEELNVKYTLDNGANWTLIENYNTIVNEYTETIITIPEGACKNGVKFGFQAIYHDANSVYIDDVRIFKETTLPSYSITPSVTGNGTLSFSPTGNVEVGKTVTVTASATAAGAALTSLRYLREDGRTIDIDIESLPYTFTMPECNTTVTAVFEDAPHCTVTLHVNGLTIGSENNAYVGCPFELPTAVALEGYTFYGWTNAEIPSSTTTAPAKVAEPSATEFIPTGDCNIYAVFAKAEAGDTYTLMSYPYFEDGGSYIIGLVDSWGNTDPHAIDITGGNATVTLIQESSTGVVTSEAMRALALTANYSSTIGGYCLTNGTNHLKDNWGYVVASGSTATTAKDAFEIAWDSDNNRYGLKSMVNDANYWVWFKTSVQGDITFEPNNYGGSTLKIYKAAMTNKYYTYIANAPINNSLTINGNASVTNPIIIGSGAVVTVNGTFTNGTASNLIINDGGQLIVNNGGVMATAQKHVEYSAINSKESNTTWYTISSPLKAATEFNNVENLIPTAVTETDYDLYRLDEVNWMWENSKTNEGTVNTAFTTIDKGCGYIYSRHVTGAVEIAFAGEINVDDVDVNVTNTAGKGNGFNLIGNPFMQNIALTNVESQGTTALANGFYVLNHNDSWGTKIESGNIAPLQGFLVQATTAGKVTINKPTSGSKGERSEQNANIEIIVSNSNYSDNAYAMFSDGIGLNKISHRNADAPMVYIPQNSENFAIAMMDESVTMFPLNFKAMTTGYYTISLKSSQIYEGYNDFDYLHLIDNMTGEGIDMLLEDGYKFVGSPRDNENRFTVKLHRNGVEENEAEDINFVYQNGNSLVINGEGTFQLIDILGRVVISKEIHGETVSVDNLITGAYIVRMIGNEVKTQKIVIK